MQIDAFMPAVAGSQTIAVNAVSQQLTASGSGNDVEIQNAGTIAVFVEQDQTNNTPTAVVATSYPVLPGQSKVIRLRPGVTKLAVIGASAGPTTVYFSFGDGV